MHIYIDIHICTLVTLYTMSYRIRDGHLTEVVPLFFLLLQSLLPPLCLAAKICGNNTGGWMDFGSEFFALNLGLKISKDIQVAYDLFSV